MSLGDTLESFDSHLTPKHELLRENSEPDQFLPQNQPYTPSSTGNSEDPDMFMEKHLGSSQYSSYDKPQLDHVEYGGISAPNHSINQDLLVKSEPDNSSGYHEQIPYYKTEQNEASGMPSYVQKQSPPPQHQHQAQPQHQQQHQQQSQQVQQHQLLNDHDSVPRFKSQPQEPSSNVQYKAPFSVDLDMVRRTMEGVNKALGVDLGGTQVTESALHEQPNYDSSSDNNDHKDSSTSSGSKSEMSHVRLICDACGHIVVSVGNAVLEAAEESAKENYLRGIPPQPPKPPIRKKRGGVLGFKELANRANLSPWHFHRVFRFVTGVTPKAYGEALWEYLMIDAGFNLENEDLTISQAVDRQGEGATAANKLSNSSSSSNGSPESPIPGNITLSNGTATNLSHPMSIDEGAANLRHSPKQSMGGEYNSNLGSSDDLMTLQQEDRSSGTPQLNGSNPNASGANSASVGSAPTGGSTTGPVKQIGQNIAPLSGSVAPGRIRKASSRSRGARSRSRNRSQTQSQILSGLAIEPGNAPEGMSLNRGRSVSRVSQRPFISAEPVMHGYYRTGSAVDTGCPGGIADSTSPEDQVPMPLSDPMGVMNSLRDDFVNTDMMMHHRVPSSSFDVPDLNSLTLQPMEPSGNSMGINEVPNGGNLDSLDFDLNHPAYFSQYNNQEPASYMQLSHNNNVNGAGNDNGNLGGDSNINHTSGKQHLSNPDSSTGSTNSNAHSNTNTNNSINNNINNHTLSSPAIGNNMHSSVNCYGQPHDQPLRYIPSPMADLETEATSLTGGIFSENLNSPELAGDKHNISNIHGGSSNGANGANGKYGSDNHHNYAISGPGQQHQNHGNYNGYSNDNQMNSRGMVNNADGFSGDGNLRDNLHNEMLNPQFGDDLKLDQLGDLPSYFYMSNADKSGYDDEQSGYMSALIGDEDPPLMPSWNAADDRNDSTYNF